MTNRETCSPKDAAFAKVGPALQRGDSCAIAGRAKLSEWTGQDGTTKRGLSVVADRVLTAYMAGKARKAAREVEEAAA